MGTTHLGMQSGCRGICRAARDRTQTIRHPQKVVAQIDSVPEFRLSWISKSTDTENPHRVRLSGLFFSYRRIFGRLHPRKACAIVILGVGHMSSGAVLSPEAVPYSGEPG